MARIEIYGNDSNVTLDDKVIGTDALDNSTKNFTVGAMLALSSAGTTYTAGTGIDITNNVISSTVVDTDTNNFVSNVVLNGTDLDFTGTGGAFQSSVSLSTIADQTVTLTGASGITVAGTYPNFTISSSVADTNTTYDYGAVGVGNNISLALSGSDGSNDVVTMQAGSKITLTDNGSNTFTVAHNIIGTAKTTNTTALVSGGTFKAIDAVTYSDGHLTQYREQTYTLPTAALPESLILRLAGGQIPITNAPGTELDFVGIDQLTKTHSVHINPVELSLASASEIEVVNACTAKVSLGAYIDNGGQSGHITFEFYEYLLGPPTLLGSASFYISNQSPPPAPTTFLSFFDFQAGAIYKFTAYSANHAMIILPGSFIQIEILK